MAQIIVPPPLLASPCPQASAYPVPSVPATVEWLGSTSATLFPWPIIVLLVLAYFAFSMQARRAAVRTLLGLRIKSVKLAAAEVELDTEARKDVQVAAADIAAELKSYAERLDETIARRVDEFGLRELLERFLNEFLLVSLVNAPEDFRCTIFIADPLLKDYLYQLVDYFPKGEGAGRRFSVRFGMIGRVWRTRTPFRVGTLFSDEDKNTAGTPTEKRQVVASRWGMTQEEAQHAMERPSYVAVPIEYDYRTYGILYADAKNENAFEPLADVVAKVAASPANAGVSTASQSDRFVGVIKDEISRRCITDALVHLVEKLRDLETRVSLGWSS